MLFAGAALARRIESAEATLVSDLTRGVGARRGPASVYIQPLGGGTAAFAGPGSPMNKAAGLGFESIDEAALEAVEKEFAARETPVQVEVSTLGDPAVCEMLTRRGYVLRGFENVLGLALEGAARNEPAAGSHRGDPQAAAIRVDLAPPDRQWIDVVATGFMHPDVYDGPPSHETISREALDQIFEDTNEVPGFHRFLAWRDGEIAGGGGMRIWNDIAQLNGAATLPAHRRRGVQSALLQYRLSVAARAGCDFAVVTTAPGSKSQENVQRQGFSLLYARAVLVK